MLVGPWGLRAPAGRAARQVGLRYAAFAPGIQITTDNQMPTWVHSINNSTLLYNGIFLPSIHYLLIYKYLSSWSPCLLFDWKIFKDVETASFGKMTILFVKQFYQAVKFKVSNIIIVFFFSIKKVDFCKKIKNPQNSSERCFSCPSSSFSYFNTELTFFLVVILIFGLDTTLVM